MAALAGLLLLLTVLWDAFETVVLPRRVSRRLRLTSLFYRATWRPFAFGARLFRTVNRREACTQWRRSQVRRRHGLNPGPKWGVSFAHGCAKNGSGAA